MKKWEETKNGNRRREGGKERGRKRKREREGELKMDNILVRRSINVVFTRSRLFRKRPVRRKLACGVPVYGFHPDS